MDIVGVIWNEDNEDFTFQQLTNIDQVEVLVEKTFVNEQFVHYILKKSKLYHCRFEKTDTIKVL